MMPPPGKRKSDQIKQLARDLDKALVHGARVYAGLPSSDGKMTSSTRQAIVAAHFRRGNAERYGWPPLSPKYAAWKAKKFPGRPQMVLTRLLRSSIVGRGSTRLIGRGRVQLLWRGLPDYVVHLIAQGRNPVEPDAADRKAVIRAMKRWLDRRYNRKRSATTTPGRALTRAGRPIV